MTGKRLPPRWLAVGLAALLGGCTTVGPDFKRPAVPWLTDWRGGSLETLAAERPAKPRAPTEEWWRNFDDPVLDALVAEALRVNHSVRTAGMRIMEARAQLGVAGSLLYPQLQQVTGEVLRVGEQRAPSPGTAFTTASAAFSIGWELDFWGKFRRGVEAADAGYFASIAQYDDIQVLMASQVASLYCAIRTLELRLRITQENLALQKRSLEITEKLFKSGNDTELDVQQAKAQYLATLATIPQIEASLRQTQNALSVLLARPPGPLPEMADGKGTVPAAELALIADLPAELLRRRPDVRTVELQLAAQSALIGVSEAELYPSLSLLGSLGVSSTSLPNSPRTFNWAVGPSLVWNVFDYGRLTNQVLVQDARFQQIYEQYQEAVLRAAREVDDAAVGFAKSREQSEILAQGVQAARRSLDIAAIQYREGLTDFQRVLDSQQTLFNQQERLVSNRGDVAQNLIALYKAMGGGWQAGRERPPVEVAPAETMAKPGDWQRLMAAPLPPPGAGPQLIEQKAGE